LITPEIAKRYRDAYGFSVIPLLGNKKPVLKWEEFQKRKATDQEIDSWFYGHPDYMIGIVTGEISDLTVVDIDDDAGKENMAKLLPDGLDAPTVHTPRGGFHLYCRYYRGLRNMARLMPGVDIRSEGGYVVAPPSVNDDDRRYVWDVAAHPEDVQRPAMPDALAQVMFKPTAAIITPGKDMFVQGTRDEDLFHVANTLVKGGMVADRVQAVLTILAKNCQPPFPEDEVDIKVRSAMDRGLRRDGTLTQDVADWIRDATGVFTANEMSKSLSIPDTREAKSNLSKALARMIEKGAIVRHGTRNGEYRKIDDECLEMEWRSANVKTFDVYWPLGLNALFVTYPKNICVLAGAKDAGKTALCLDFIKHNMAKHNIQYFTNEMGPEELKMRIAKHTDLGPDDWKFNAYERGDNYEDVIDPTGINVIDYVELNDACYMVGDILKKIHQKLTTGIALVCLQKSFGATLGRGADFGLQRPRLYVTLDRGVAKIVTAKNRVPGLGFNPTGYICRYKLFDGAGVSSEEWHSPEAEEEMNKGFDGMFKPRPGFGAGRGFAR